jgi:hypothetical protein
MLARYELASYPVLFQSFNFKSCLRWILREIRDEPPIPFFARFGA